jgi:hypothetical protein
MRTNSPRHACFGTPAVICGFVRTAAGSTRDGDRPRADESGGGPSGSRRCVRTFWIGPGSVMNAISRMSPPHRGHCGGSSSPICAISFVHATREVSCERTPVGRNHPLLHGHRRDHVINEVGGGLCHVAAITGWADPAPLAGEGDDNPLATTRAESTAEPEPEAEDAALEIAAESGNTHDQRVIDDNPTRRRPIAARLGSRRSG